MTRGLLTRLSAANPVAEISSSTEQQRDAVLHAVLATAAGPPTPDLRSRRRLRPRLAARRGAIAGAFVVVLGVGAATAGSHWLSGAHRGGLGGDRGHARRRGAAHGRR
ncbi:MAG TPA: hypothetical protein VHZ31_01775 [Solirubrobacteraceae bacterium]|jgi:hypothetical protein|nr:hypothetical protein [Solirubrobacteraceae bacterium]